jgi:hypothetical protein
MCELFFVEFLFLGDCFTVLRAEAAHLRFDTIESL